MIYNLYNIASLKLTEDVFIEGIACDSNKIGKNFAFFAINGTSSDGRKYIQPSIDKGAKVIFYAKDENYNYPLKKNDVYFIATDNVRQTMSDVTNAFYHNKPSHIVAITGTNGKTSIAHFYQQILQYLGKNSASIGTVGVIKNGQSLPGYYALTTPDIITVNQILSDLKHDDVDYVSIEASSHGIDQGRLNGINFQAAAFSNLSQDHLDYHGSMENYLSAKIKLFTEVMEKGKVAILNADIAEFDKIRDVCISASHQIIDYGKKANILKINILKNNIKEQLIDFDYLGKNYQINTKVIGEFQAYNILCALGLAIATGANVNEAIRVLPMLENAPGRMERVASSNIFVDFAHTPDSLEKALELLKPLCRGKLIVLFGCGGNRDKVKRPIMGRIACKLASIVIVTDDNPRFEDPAAIRADIISACDKMAIEVDGRAKAIEHAINLMQEDDILLIAGKGHEKDQIIKDKIYPFDDVEVASSAIRCLK
jgi:UDP-N-acetylmuramoyl-L-alanyl-D-glutamate--2,6-diaminopimelate ligase